MKKLVWIFFVFLPHFLFAQYGQDSTDYQYKSFVRLGLGYQKSSNAELGISRRKFIGEDMFLGTQLFYCAVEYTPTFLPMKDKAIYGIKAGYDWNMMGLGLAVEAKYISDLSVSDFIFTPKIGLNIMGDLYIYYGYNILSKNTFKDYIGHSQFSIGFTLRKHWGNL